MKKALILIVMVVLVLAVFITKTVYQAGQFKSIQPHFSGTVNFIDGIVGGEDITIHKSGIAFISSDDRFKGWHGLEGWEGGIYSLDLTTPDSKPVLLTPHLNFEFNPHGISIFESEDKTIYLYAVDHAGHSHAIRLFKYDPAGKLIFLRKFIHDDFMISPNDVLAIDENRFYFTNDHGSLREPGRTIEEYLQLRKSNVVYFNGTDFKIVANKIGYANGINMSRDGREVFVAATVDRSVWVYDRDAVSGNLHLKDQIFLNTGVDNIELDDEDNLWIACHPKMLSFVAHSKDLSKPSPSQVVKVWRDESGQYQHKEIYLNGGEELSASSVAAVWENTLLIGPVFDDHLLRCELDL